MAGVEVKVVAEPKRGLRREASEDYTISGPSDPFVRLDYNAVPGIVVWLEPTDAPSALSAAPDAPTTITVDETRPTAPPAVQGIAVGSRLIFKNQSSRPQTIYSVSEGNEFDLDVIRSGQQAQYVVRSAGLIEVLCESLPQPVARLYAVPSPWVRNVQSNQTFCVGGLRPGSYRVACWNERLPGSQQVVSLSPDKWSNVTVKLSVNLLPAFSNSPR